MCVCMSTPSLASVSWDLYYLSDVFLANHDEFLNFSFNVFRNECKSSCDFPYVENGSYTYLIIVYVLG